MSLFNSSKNRGARTQNLESGYHLWRTLKFVPCRKKVQFEFNTGYERNEKVKPEFFDLLQVSSKSNIFHFKKKFVKTQFYEKTDLGFWKGKSLVFICFLKS